MGFSVGDRTLVQSVWIQRPRGMLDSEGNGIQEGDTNQNLVFRTGQVIQRSSAGKESIDQQRTKAIMQLFHYKKVSWIDELSKARQPTLEESAGRPGQAGTTKADIAPHLVLLFNEFLKDLQWRLTGNNMKTECFWAKERVRGQIVNYIQVTFTFDVELPPPDEDNDQTEPGVWIRRLIDEGISQEEETLSLFSQMASGVESMGIVVSILCTIACVMISWFFFKKN